MKPPLPESTAAKLRKLSSLQPTLAIVLGSGFAEVLTDVDAQARIAYEDLPGFPPVGVDGHQGELVVGHWVGKAVIVLAGRAHYYEGHALSAVTFAVRVLAASGVRELLLTNAAGAISPRLRVGDLMVLKDHINFMGTNPLCGPPLPGLPRFVDLNCTYDADMRRQLHRAGRDCGVRLRTGVYLAVSGPCFETPAEIRAFRKLGADAVGMSTVPEAIVARQCGIRVAAISCITNLAAGLSHRPLSHQEVLETAARVQTATRKVLKRFVARHGKPTFASAHRLGP
jgi:purine-nucleoside phosphorylase